jgi:perosamine synthetase
MSLHGLSNDAWGRFSGKGAWDYQIVSPGYKYNLTDIAASIGIHQLAKAEQMRLEREEVAKCYLDQMSELSEIELPLWSENRIHSWHLFPVRLKLENFSIDRNTIMEELKQRGVGCSVHWRPLHLHPLYQELSWNEEDFPVATALWEQLISLPIFPAMREGEIRHVVETVKEICAIYSLNRYSRVA